MGAWVGAISALAAVATILLRMWWESRPARKVKKGRSENADISDDVRAGDADAVDRRVRKWMDEDG